MNANLSKILSYTDTQQDYLNIALVSRKLNKISTEDSVWQRFNVCNTGNIYRHFLHAKSTFSAFELLLWTTPADDWASLIWDSDCEPTTIRNWHPYTQLLLVTSRYRYDIFEKMVTNENVIRFAIGVPLSYQHYAAFEDRELLLLSIKNRLPERTLKAIFSDYDDDYEVQMAVASFHGDFFTEFPHGKRELLLAALQTGPTRTPTCLVGSEIDDLEILEATLQIRDTGSLSFRPSKRLLNDPAKTLQIAELCGVNMLNSYKAQNLTDRDLILAHLKRRDLRSIEPRLAYNSAIRYNLSAGDTGEYQVSLLACDERLYPYLDIPRRRRSVILKAISLNPNVYYHCARVRGAKETVAEHSYSLITELYEQHCNNNERPARGRSSADWDSLLATQPRRYGRRPRYTSAIGNGCFVRSDYGPCIFRNRVAISRDAHKQQMSNQQLTPYDEYRAAQMSIMSQNSQSREPVPPASGASERASQKLALLSLPLRCLHKIFGHTNATREEILRYSRVCKYFYSYFTSSRAWKGSPQALKYYRDGQDSEMSIGRQFPNGYKEYLKERKRSIFDPSDPLPDPAVNRPHFMTHIQGLLTAVRAPSDIWYLDEFKRVMRRLGGGINWCMDLEGNNFTEILWSDVETAKAVHSARTISHLDICLTLVKGAIEGIYMNPERLIATLAQEWPWVIDYTVDESILWRFTEKTTLVVPHLEYNRGLAICALSRKPSVLPSFIKGPIKDKKVLILAAECKTKNNVYSCIDSELLKDRQFMYEFFSASGWQIRFADSEKNDEDYVTAAFESFCDKRLLNMISLRTERVALAAISYDAQLYWEFPYRTTDFNKLAMARNCDLWDTLKSFELAHIAAAQDYRCWLQVSKDYQVPEPETRKLNGYHRVPRELQKPRQAKALVLRPRIETHDTCSSIWNRYRNYAEYRADLGL